MPSMGRLGTSWKRVSDASTVQWIATGGGGVVTAIGSLIGWMRDLELPWLCLLVAVGIFATTGIFALFKFIRELSMPARIAELERELAAALAANAREADQMRVAAERHREQMDMQANQISALREQSFSNR